MLPRQIASSCVTTRSHPWLRAGLLLASAAAMPVQAEDTVLPQITVTESSKKKKLSERISGGALGERSERETPFSTRAVSSEEIEDRQAGSLAEVLKYDASVSNNSPVNSTHPATVAVRGLRLDDLNGYKIDGLANINRGTEMPLEMFEQVDVLKGLSGFMYGFGSPGGIINYVSKRPTDDALLSADIGYASGGTWKQHIDAGGRLGDEQRYGYRINLVNESGGTAADHGTLNRQAIGASLDARVTSDLILRLDAIYQRRTVQGGTDVIVDRFRIPAPLAGTTRLYSDGADTDVDYRLATLSADYRLAEQWKATLSLRHAQSVRIYKRDQYFITSNSGNYRDRLTAKYHGYAFDQAQGMVQGKLSTGGLQHALVVGAMTQDLVSTSSVNTPRASLATGSLSAPVIRSADRVNYSGGTYRDQQTSEKALFASDTLTLSERWSVLAGLRYTDYADRSRPASTAATTRFEAAALSPTAALMYQPRTDTTLYGSYAEALEQGELAPSSTRNANQSFAPVKSTQTELGVKSEHETWSGSLALFRIERGSQYIDGANYFVADGRSIYRGIELNAALQLTRDLSVEGSAMLMHSEVTRTRAALNGKRPVGAARVQAGAQLRYRVPTLPGLSLHAGAQHVGSMALDSANTNMISPYSLFDAGLNYRTRIGGRMTTWSANLTNLSNRRYWTYYQENHLNVGAPRTLSLKLGAEF